MKSLAEVGKADLINKDITVVVPAPLEVQLEASGRQYKIPAPVKDGGDNAGQTPVGTGMKFGKFGFRIGFGKGK